MKAIDTLLVVVDASTQGAVREFDSLQRSAKQTDASMSGLSINAQKFGSVLKAGLVAGASALVGGQLVSFLNDAVDQFGNAAKSANDLAKASGSTVETVSRMTAALEDAGVSSETTAGLLTKFTTNAGKSKKTLDDLGVVLKTNRDGTVDYADGLVQAVDAINRIGDASERNQKFVELFGKQGAKAFQDLANSGIPLSQAMEAISKYRVFTADDVAKAVAYDDAVDTLNASVQGLKFSLGRDLIPAVSGAAENLANLIDFVSTLPGPVVDLGIAVAGAAGGLFAFKKAMDFFKSEKFGELFVGLIDNFAGLTAGFVDAEGAAGKAGVAIRGFGAALKAALVSVGPFLLLTAAIEGVMNAMSATERTSTFLSGLSQRGKGLEDLAKGLRDTDSVIDSIMSWELPDLWGDSSMNERDQTRVVNNYRERAKATLESAEASETEKRAAQDLLDIINRGVDENDRLGAAKRRSNLATQEGTDAMALYEAALSPAEDAAVRLGIAQRDLADLLAQGVTAGSEFAGAVADAAEKQYEQEAASRLGKAAVEAYTASTWLAVDATLAMFSAQASAESAQRGFNEALKDYNTVAEGGKEKDAEQRAADAEKLAEAAWRLAEANVAAWEAEQKRYGAYPTQSQLDLKRIEELRKAALQVPEGSEIRGKLDQQVGRALAAWAAANPLQIPAGVDVGTVDTAIAAIKAQIAANEDPEIETQLALDLASLIALKQTIESAPPGEVPVEPVLRSGAQTAQQVVDPTGAPVGVTVVASVKDGQTAYRAVQADGTVVDVTVRATKDPSGKTVQEVVAPDGTVIGVLLQPTAPAPAPSPGEVLGWTDAPQVPVTVVPETSGAQGELDGLTAPREAPVVATPQNVPEAGSALDGLSVLRDAPILPTVVDGIPSAGEQIDALTGLRTVPITPFVQETAPTVAEVLAGLTVPKPIPFVPRLEDFPADDGAELTALTVLRTIPIQPTPVGVPAAAGQLDALTVLRNAPVVAVPEGIGATTGAIDSTAVPRTAPVVADPRQVTTAKSVLDGIALPRTAPVTPVTAGVSGFQSAISSLLAPRTLQVYVKYNGEVNRQNLRPGQSPVPQMLTVLRVPSVPRVRVPDIYPSYSPTNIFKVNLEGTPLRAMIREEVAALQPAYQGVA